MQNLGGSIGRLCQTIKPLILLRLHAVNSLARPLRWMLYAADSALIIPREHCMGPCWTLKSWQKFIWSWLVAGSQIWFCPAQRSKHPPMAHNPPIGAPRLDQNPWHPGCQTKKKRRTKHSSPLWDLMHFGQKRLSLLSLSRFQQHAVEFHCDTIERNPLSRG